mgnify:CR=1 FL=1
MMIIKAPIIPYSSIIIEKIKNRFNNDSLYHCASILKPTMILSISGCFSPIHAGHISALTTAKEYYESLGHKVMGVIIPANDSYVNNMKNEYKNKRIK